MSCGHSHMIPLPPVGDGSQTSRAGGRTGDGDPSRRAAAGRAAARGRDRRRRIMSAAQSCARRCSGSRPRGWRRSCSTRAPVCERADERAVDDMMELHVQLTALAARNAAERASAGADRTASAQFVDMLEHVAEDGGPAEEFQHLRIGFARALFEAAGPVLAERLRSAAPVTPHHARRDGRCADGGRAGRGGEAERAMC